jgi:hypothetical protein
VNSHTPTLQLFVDLAASSPRCPHPRQVLPPRRARKISFALTFCGISLD